MKDSCQPEPPSRLRRALRLASAVGTVVVVLGYPLAIYFGLTHFRPRTVGLMLAVVLLPTLVLRIKRARRMHLRSLVLMPVLVLVLVSLSIIIDDHRFILVLPVLINAALLGVFAGSLRQEISTVERFARLQVDDLSPAEIRYCRVVTALWCVFFAVNAIAAAALALAGQLAWWSLYNGLLTYIALGVLFAAEFVVRKYRFRRYGRGLVDRALSRLFPPPPPP